MIKADLQKLNAGVIVELYQIHTEDNIYYLHNGVNEIGESVVFDGNVYTRFPIEASDFQKSSQGAIPRPKLKVANVIGLIGALLKETDDLIGSKVIRIRTFAKYLDAVNFKDGINPQADPSAIIDQEIWFVDRKVSENAIFVELELTAAYDVEGTRLPRRQIVQNVCIWKYRSSQCGYTGEPVADQMDRPTSDPEKDVCGKRLNSCKLRFGVLNQLPFGCFPSAGLIRS